MSDQAQIPADLSDHPPAAAAVAVTRGAVAAEVDQIAEGHCARFARKRRGPRCLSPSISPAASPNSTINGTDDYTVAALEVIAANTLEKMNVDDVNAAPKTTMPELPLGALITGHTQLCTCLMWDLPVLHPTQTAALEKIFSKNNTMILSGPLRI